MSSSDLSSVAADLLSCRLLNASTQFLMNDMLSQDFHVFLIGSTVSSHLLKNGSRWIVYIKLPLNVNVGTPKPPYMCDVLGYTTGSP